MRANWLPATTPIARRVRGYFAPVERVGVGPAVFDPARGAGFDVDAPPAPWMDMGCLQGFVRTSGSKRAVVQTGAPAAALAQVREGLDAQVSFEFVAWTKLSMALATGSQHMNVLAAPDWADAAAVGGVARPAVGVLNGSSATSIVLAPGDAALFEAGQMVAVDADYAGETGYVGTPIAGAYLRQAVADVDYARRVTFNVALIAETTATGLTLAQALPGGAPRAGAKAQVVTAFVDREGGSFCQEWSGLFVVEGTQGERIFFHYPRLQAVGGGEEAASPLVERTKGGHERVALKAKFLALPVNDPLDGERVVCYRSFVPAARALV